jgi:hypothetical protein
VPVLSSGSNVRTMPTILGWNVLRASRSNKHDQGTVGSGPLGDDRATYTNPGRPLQEKSLPTGHMGAAGWDEVCLKLVFGSELDV